MTHLLWKHYWDDDVDKFRRLLAPTTYNAQAGVRSPKIGPVGSQSPSLGTSPRLVKGRKGSAAGLGKNEVNGRDHTGLTVLLRAASSTSRNALAFVQALLEHPAIDIYAQDPESGWNALHRALYAGNISIARLLLEKERKDLTGHARGASAAKVAQLIKTKDHEGNSPFDLYNSTIAERLLKVPEDDDAGSDSDSDAASISRDKISSSLLDGDEIFAFGSNKNISLGFGDHDDRQFPERVYLQRPDQLIQRFYEEYLDEAGLDSPASFDTAQVPALVQNKPLMIHDVVLSKLHSAVLTADPVSNLYVCGIGRGGRLGLGDENTRFTYAPVLGGLAEKKVVQVALGQNHTLAVTDDGELWTWGSNAHSQLGYSLPTPAKDEDPMSPYPRQVFGALKKEVIIGVAASSIHSVAHTETSLYCWGRNVGQLALMDADSRSLDVQQSPRKVAASMFSSPIVMVSAIDKATTVLLQNHTVCVFTGYGYHIVRFPFAEMLASRHLSNTSMSTRYEPGRNQIQYITSGGETIAAVTGRGDLFTMALNHKIDSNVGATSTTNPSKLKGAITQPQCIWNARKDGVRSVGVSEHGSVIISTESGAVWRRIKRAHAKDVYVDGSERRRKDFKFQRVPYITKVATVRASAFGAFAAIRKDSTVMKEQVDVDEQTLWDDVASLNSLSGFEASPSGLSKGQSALSFSGAEALQDRLGPVAYEVLRSPDLESDLKRHLDNWSYANDPLDAVLCTSGAPELKIPVHRWLLAARSPALRSGLAKFHKTEHYDLPETFSIQETDGRAVITLHGLDVLSLLNLVLYMYEDTLIPAWNFTRQAAALAYRYRQVRVELMKAATRLQMPNLETAVRIQTRPTRCLDQDLRAATRDRTFFDDGDTLLELDGMDVTVHSSLVCQRCPWFGGLFHGRSRGLWLAGRREEQEASDKVRIDLKHMEPRVFKYVLQYLYGDLGAELFDPTISASLDDFLDDVMAVMAIADELMLDRLSQICQHIMGRFVHNRNIAHLLNEISPFAVTEFKDAGLEYICLQMESMLENHFLDGLDEDLVLELDEVVRENQAAQLRYARKGLIEEKLLEQYPELAQDIDEERQRRVRELAFKAAQKDDDKKLSSSLKGRYGSFDDMTALTPDRARRSSRAARNEPFSPNLRPKESQAELMFDMDEEDSSVVSSPLTRPQRRIQASEAAELDQLATLGESWNDPGRKDAPELAGSLLSSPAASLPSRPALPRGTSSSEAVPSLPAAGGNPWQRTTLATAKMDLKDIIQFETKTHSALSAGLAAQKAKDTDRKPSQPKMSQKERKKQQQAQAAQAAFLASTPPPKAWDASADTQASPWKTVSKSKTSLKDVFPAGSQPSTSAMAKPLVADEASSSSFPRRTASPDTRFSGQSRKPSSASTQTSKALGKSPLPSQAPSASQTPPRPLVPHSKSYISPAPPKIQHELGASMADIIGQQQREQEIVKEAVAKRSLQEIQEEQAFQEWWDAESRRTQEEEARRLGKDKDRDNTPKKGARRGRGGKGRDGAAGGGSTNSNGRASGGGNTGPKVGSSGAQGGSTGHPRGRGRGREGRGGTPALTAGRP
ncbi:hypothetical protein GQ53DRAFT_666285 [Thozetella sp. PMI_491]|nr:hypothetical protein GQ53DRAFT_666285 [Thozetella sp. PMI_491]